MQERILVVDNDEGSLRLLEYNLWRAGYEVGTATTGEAALATITDRSPDLIILDIELPGMDGFDLCRKLRLREPVPIMIVSARDEEIDRIIAFELGVDDYVVKPFSPRELVGRVKAILRRRSARSDGTRKRVVACGPLQIDPTSHEVTVHAQRVALTPTEYQILKLMAEHPKRVFGRQDLALRVFGEERSGRIRTIDVHIRHLRAKLSAAAGSEIELIETVRGAGYRFAGSKEA